MRSLMIGLLLSSWMSSANAVSACEGNADWPVCQLSRLSLSECNSTSGRSSCARRFVRLYDAEMEALRTEFPEFQPLFDQVPVTLCEAYSADWNELVADYYRPICPSGIRIETTDIAVPKACVRYRHVLTGREDDLHALDAPGTDREKALAVCRTSSLPQYCGTSGWDQAYRHEFYSARYIHPVQVLATMATRQQTTRLVRAYRARKNIETDLSVARRAVAFRSRINLSTLYAGETAFSPEDFNQIESSCQSDGV